MDWLDKHLPLLIAVASAIATIWSIAMGYAKLEQNRTDTEKLRKDVDEHLKDGNKHLDPVRDERRLTKIEQAIEEWGDRLDEKYERLLKIVMDIRNSTKGL